VLALPRTAGAVGLEGAQGASSRFGMGLGTGWDQVGGVVGQDAFPFGEVYGHAEARVWRRLTVSGALSLRGDVANYNFSLERWRRGSVAIAAWTAIGYDGPSFHLSVGPWIYGDDRDGRALRPGISPWGVVRLRFGSLDRWHFNLQLVDGAPFTAEGAGPGLRLQLGAPPRGAHRLTGGLYTSPFENTVGISLTDEITGTALVPAGALRVGGTLGADVVHPGRPELTAFVGLVW
jgi:hypothetical protein